MTPYQIHIYNTILQISSFTTWRGHVVNMHGTCVGHVCYKRGTCVVHVWYMCDTFMV